MKARGRRSPCLHGTACDSHARRGGGKCLFYDGKRDRVEPVDDFDSDKSDRRVMSWLAVIIAASLFAIVLAKLYYE